MATKISTTARNAACDAIVDLFDADAGPGTIKIYTGAQPADPQTAPSGTLLATFTCADPAFGNSATGTATLAGTPLATTGLAAGTAGWWRGADQSGDAVMDGSVTATGGGGQIELNTTTISVGVAVEITSGTVTMPGS